MPNTHAMEIPWTVLAPMIFVYFAWRHMMAVAYFLLSCSTTSRDFTIKAGLKAYTLWHYLRSLALVSVTWQTGQTTRIQQPVVKFIVGHGGGGRTCGSLVVYSPEDPKEEEAPSVPFDE